MMNISKTLRITLIGDSISQGLGKKHYNFCEELKCNVSKTLNCNCEICNLSMTGKTIMYANEIRREIDLSSPDIIILFLGSVDGILRPKRRGRLWGFVPNRYKQNGMLDPRPFFSHKKCRSMFEHLDSWLRWHLKLFLMKQYGTYCIVSLNDFEREYRSFLECFQNMEIIAVSPVYVDQKYFPGSNESLVKYANCIYELTKEFEQSFVDLIELQKQKKWSEIYNADHFHPNKRGYTWLSEVFTKAVLSQIDKWQKTKDQERI